LGHEGVAQFTRLAGGAVGPLSLGLLAGLGCLESLLQGFNGPDCARGGLAVIVPLALQVGDGLIAPGAGLNVEGHGCLTFQRRSWVAFRRAAGCWFRKRGTTPRSWPPGRVSGRARRWPGLPGACR